MKNIIELNIKYKYFKKKGHTILNNFGLFISSGESIAIMGESGVGKTSLLNILGLLDTNYEGNYFLLENSMEDYSSKEKAIIRNENIGFILQESSLIDSISLEDNIKLPLLYSKNKKEAEVFYKEITSKMNIKSILSKKPLECSGGQRSRAVIARALIMQPDIILADEPTASLDEENKLHVLEILKKLNQEFGSTIITVTHDRSVAEQHNRIISLE